MIPRTTTPLRIVPGSKHGSGCARRRGMQRRGIPPYTPAERRAPRARLDRQEKTCRMFAHYLVAEGAASAAQTRSSWRLRRLQGGRTGPDVFFYRAWCGRHWRGASRPHAPAPDGSGVCSMLVRAAACRGAGAAFAFVARYAAHLCLDARPPLGLYWTGTSPTGRPDGKTEAFRRHGILGRPSTSSSRATVQRHRLAAPTAAPARRQRERWQPRPCWAAC
jgi:hypothetical protein